MNKQDKIRYGETEPDFIVLDKPTKLYVLEDETSRLTLTNPEFEDVTIAFTNYILADRFNRMSESMDPDVVVKFNTFLPGTRVIIADYMYLLDGFESGVHLIDMNKLAKYQVQDDSLNFTIHTVIDDNLSEEERFDENLCHYANIHTHGLNKYDHLEFQMVLYDEERTVQVMNRLSDLVVLGFRFGPGEMCGRDISFMEFPDHTTPGEKLLRIIFADPEGKFPWEDDCMDVYKLQMEDRW